ncbi:hypothetical protein BSG1_19550 [Bacillus sp. SG-1]|nr:hypothetical protein BSG1_19550 [Bacillus sp. SG-1]
MNICIRKIASVAAVPHSALQKQENGFAHHVEMTSLPHRFSMHQASFKLIKKSFL